MDSLLLQETLKEVPGICEVSNLNKGRSYRIDSKTSSWLLKFHSGANGLRNHENEKRFLSDFGHLVGYSAPVACDLIPLPDSLNYNGVESKWSVYQWLPGAPVIAVREPQLLAYLMDICSTLEGVGQTGKLDRFDWGGHSDIIRSRINRARASSSDDVTLFDLLESEVLPIVASRVDATMPRNVWCHGDLKPSNIIKLPNGSFQAIDWESVHLDVAGYDLAYFFLESSCNRSTLTAESCLDFFDLLDMPSNGIFAGGEGRENFWAVSLAILAGQIAMLMARGNHPKTDEYLAERIDVLQAVLKILEGTSM